MVTGELKEEEIKMYKMIAIDFDDTLFGDNLTISPENLNAITEAKQKGVTIVYCSGRSSDSMMHYIRQIDTHLDHEYYISYNGAVISTIGGEEIFKRTIEQPFLAELVDIGRQHQVNIQLYQNHMMVEEMTDTVKEYERLTNITTELVPDLKALDDTIKVLYNSQEIDVLKQIKQQVETRYGSQFNVFFSKPNYLEVLNQEANKGLAVKRMAEMLGIKQEEVIAIGDSYNDLYMIEYAGLGIAMKNGRNGVKQRADYITERDNNHHAIKEVIDKFILKG